MEANVFTVFGWIGLSVAIAAYMMSPKLREFMKDSRVKEEEEKERKKEEDATS